MMDTTRTKPTPFYQLDQRGGTFNRLIVVIGESEATASYKCKYHNEIIHYYSRGNKRMNMYHVNTS